MNMAFLIKRKKELFCNNAFKCKLTIAFTQNVQMYIIMKTAIILIVMMLYLLGKMILFLLIVSFTCIPPLGSATIGDNAPPCLHSQ